MKVVIDGVIYDPNDTPIMLLFKNDDERVAISEQLKNFEAKADAPRAMSFHPSGHYTKNSFLEYSNKMISEAYVH